MDLVDLSLIVVDHVDLVHQGQIHIARGPCSSETNIIPLEILGQQFIYLFSNNCKFLDLYDVKGNNGILH